MFQLLSSHLLNKKEDGGEERGRTATERKKERATQQVKRRDWLRSRCRKEKLSSARI